MVLTGKIKNKQLFIRFFKKISPEILKKKLKGLLYVWWGGGADKLNYPDYIFKSVCRLYTKISIYFTIMQIDRVFVLLRKN